MNEDILKGRWHQVKGDVRKRWGSITDDDVEQIQGSAEKFIGVLQERYGYAKEQAQQELDDFLSKDTPKKRTA